MFDRVAGIGGDPEQPGFKHIIIHPRPGGKITHAEGSYDSIHGKISTKWEISNGTFSLDVSIPPNTTATVEFPISDTASLQEGGHAVALNTEMKMEKNSDGLVQIQIGSGSYSFTCKWP